MDGVIISTLPPHLQKSLNHTELVVLYFGVAPQACLCKTSKIAVRAAAAGHFIDANGVGVEIPRPVNRASAEFSLAQSCLHVFTINIRNRAGETPRTWTKSKASSDSRLTYLRREACFCGMFVAGRHTSRPCRPVGNRCGHNLPRAAASN